MVTTTSILTDSVSASSTDTLLIGIPIPTSEVLTAFVLSLRIDNVRSPAYDNITITATVAIIIEGYRRDNHEKSVSVPFLSRSILLVGMSDPDSESIGTCNISIDAVSSGKDIDP
jgi:hypothetical protein